MNAPSCRTTWVCACRCHETNGRIAASFNNMDQTTGDVTSFVTNADATNGSITHTQMNFVNSNVQIGYNNTMNFHSYRSMNSDLSSESEDEDCAEDKEWTDMVDKLKLSTRIISDSELRDLSKNVGGSWRRFVRKLDIGEADIDCACHTQNNGCTPEIVYQLLLTWKRNSIEPSVSTVTYALENADLKKLLKTLKP